MFPKSLWILLWLNGVLILPDLKAQSVALDTQTDIRAVKERISLEFQAFSFRHYNQWASCWQHNSQVSWTYTDTSRKPLDLNGWQRIDEAFLLHFKNKEPFQSYAIVRQNYLVTISGDRATASFTQYQSYRGPQYDFWRTTNELRYLNRQDGDWKLTYSNTFNERRGSQSRRKEFQRINEQQRVTGFLLIPISALSILAILHLTLFLLDKRMRTNLYLCLFLTNFSLNVLSLYLESSVTDHQAAFWYKHVITLTTILIPLTASVFVYSVGQTPMPRFIRRSLQIATGLLVVWTYRPLGNLPATTMTLSNVLFLLVTLDACRVIILAIKRHQPGIWLIGLGFVGMALLFLEETSHVLGLGEVGNLNRILPIYLGYLWLPLCASLYLAAEFVRNNFDREAQSNQIQVLLQRTLEQEKEKAGLLARQNEQLEQTVRERTEAIRQQNNVLAHQKAELAQQASRLQELDVLKTHFFTNITHEFRTPLTLMLGPADLVLAQTQEPATKYQVGLLQRNAHRLLRLITQLLDLTKLEAGKMQLMPMVGDLVHTVKATLLSFESLAGHSQITLRFAAYPDQLIVAFDGDKLEKILYNLFSNAVKFTRAGGEVSVGLVSLEVEGKPWVELRVQDTGVGIRADRLPYIFDRFYQIDQSSTRDQEGTGIGLALTKELIDLYGGSIHITSQEDNGTLVKVRLPIRQEQAAHETIESTSISVPIPSVSPLSPIPEQTPAQIELPLVLLIEDNIDVRAFIRSSLQEQYRILDASNGVEGVQLASEHVPDLVITDLMMPEMDGYQVCATLKQDERTSHIPVIMLTAKADLESKLEGLKTGADSYLAKPFNHRELLAQIANLITLRRQLQERYSRDTIRQPSEIALPSMEQAFLDRVRAAIHVRLDDEFFSVDQLSEDVGLSRTQLHRKLKALINQAPGDLIRVTRLQRAFDLLSANVGTIAEIAYMVGFGDPSTFSTSFSRHFGYPPSEVRRKAGPAL